MSPNVTMESTKSQNVKIPDGKCVAKIAENAQSDYTGRRYPLKF